MNESHLKEPRGGELFSKFDFWKYRDTLYRKKSFWRKQEE